jgi:hypothetical protein
MAAQGSGEKNAKSVQASKVLGHFAKTVVRHWQQVLAVCTLEGSVSGRFLRVRATRPGQNEKRESTLRCILS